MKKDKIKEYLTKTYINFRLNLLEMLVLFGVTLFGSLVMPAISNHFNNNQTKTQVISFVKTVSDSNIILSECVMTEDLCECKLFIDGIHTLYKYTINNIENVVCKDKNITYEVVEK